MRRTKEGRIQKKSEENVRGVHICTPLTFLYIEMKKYRISEISALEGKVKKISTNLSLDEKKNNGRSIMMNMKSLMKETVIQMINQVID